MPSFAAAGWVEEDGVWYYYDSDGVIVRNTWVMVVNEDQDDDDDPAKYNYYYMQSNGKAYKQTGNSISKKTINGKMLLVGINYDKDAKGADSKKHTCLIEKI